MPTVLHQEETQEESTEMKAKQEECDRNLNEPSNDF